MLIDSHCHLDFPDLRDDLDAIVGRAQAAGVVRMVTICTRIREFDGVQAIAARFPSVSCSIGTHPHNAAEEVDITTEQIVAMASGPDVVAIGESGLDYHYDNSPRDVQKEVFRRHIAAARQTKLPLVIHARDADEDMRAILVEEMGNGPFSAVLHCFSSGRELAETGIELGYFLSFSGILTFKSAVELRAIASTVDEDRILVETDAPYLAPLPHRGKRNEPAFVAHTADVLATVRGCSSADIGRVTSENFFRLFTRVSRGPV
jgi:TatD DNase family protein